MVRYDADAVLAAMLCAHVRQAQKRARAAVPTFALDGSRVELESRVLKYLFVLFSVVSLMFDNNECHSNDCRQEPLAIKLSLATFRYTVLSQCLERNNLRPSHR